MSKVTIDEEKCPKDKQYCFKQDYGKGKKPMTENCYNEKYVPIKMLDLLLSDSKDDRQLTNCQNLCTCKQFDDAWFMVINDILARIGSLINILTKMNDKEKKTMVAESLKKSKSNSSPLQIAPILEKVIDIGSKRWDLPPNSNSNKKWDNTTNVGSFLAILEEVKNSKLIQLFDINLKNGEKINSEIMDKIHNLNNLNFNEVISHFKKIKALFELIKHLGNKKENLESTIKNELEEHVKDIIDYKLSLIHI